MREGLGPDNGDPALPCENLVVVYLDLGSACLVPAGARTANLPALAAVGSQCPSPAIDFVAAYVVEFDLQLVARLDMLE